MADETPRIPSRPVESRQWRGVLREYADRLDISDATPIVTLGEGGTPLIPAPALSARTGANVYVKFEGMNPTGSFKDRGMTMAISKALEHGAKAVICASTGNTSASAAAYATHAGITAAVLVPEGKIAMGKLSQAIAHNAQLIQVQGNFDDCLDLARDLSANYPVHLVNSVNPDRIAGQKTAAYEVVEVLQDAPDFHIVPVGNAGNYTAYTRGYTEELERGATTKLPRMFGFQAAGSAPIVLGHPVTNPETIASAIRIGNPASWELALAARDASSGYFGAISDEHILAAHRILSAEVGIFVEPASAISVAGLLERSEAGVIPAGSTVVLTVTGHGLKDPQWALRSEDGSDVKPTIVPVDAGEIASVLGLSRAESQDGAS
ncbi:threonine synthase [Herbiconiux sp. P17]|uniref:threonine synthase n=1 Tax=Herbiconiux wuyangfengii TaxID=3342794 RepID=UPI0035BB09E9